MRKVSGLMLAAVALPAVMLGALPAAAQGRAYYSAGYADPAYYNSPWAPGARGPSVEQWQQQEYHQSGTLGRMGLGADPRHPEGPGNASSPR